MTVLVDRNDLLRACRVLFGPSPSALPDVRRPDWTRTVRAAFRRRVLETHPDRAAVLGLPEPLLAERFKAVNEAYQMLVRLDADTLVTEPAPPEPSVRSAPSGQFYRGPLPRRRLRLAEFLYYTQRIPWHVLIEAITWQRQQRPLIGDIGVGWGFLTREQVDFIIQRRRADKALDVPFGEFARRQGLLTTFQLFAMIGRQKALQPRIGEYFVAAGLLLPEQTEQFVALVQRHNTRLPP